MYQILFFVADNLLSIAIVRCRKRAIVLMIHFTLLKKEYAIFFYCWSCESQKEQTA